MDLRCDTQTRTQSRRLVRSKSASWSLSWPSGAGLLVHMQLTYTLYSLRDLPLWLFPFFVFGRVLIKLGQIKKFER
jgi:hypothetical protein